MAGGPAFWFMIVLGASIALAGVFAYLVAPTRRANQFLGAMLVMNGLGPAGLIFAFPQENVGSPALQHAAWQVSVAVILSTHHLYLLFIGQALDHPWTRWLRHPAAMLTIGLSGAWMFFYGGLFQSGELTSGLGGPAMVLQLLVGIFAIVVASLVVRGQPKGSSKRSRARTYLVAFVANDVAFVGLPLVSLFGVGPYLPPDWVYMIFRSFFLISAVLISLALVRGQLLNVDHRIHLTLSRTTIAAIFIGVFVGVQTVVSEYAASSWGLAAAGVSAGLLFFAISPLQQMAERLADKAVPHGRSATKMSRGEREAFYEEQVQIAYSDGSIGAKERTILKSVRDRLGLTAAVALGIEERVVM